MIATPQEIFSILREFNPWWNRGRWPDLPPWKRVAFNELYEWIDNPPSPRAILLSGARQVGKTTLLRQAIHSLLDGGVNPEQILYATFDHPLLKLVGIEGLFKVWREMRVSGGGLEYLFLDEVQYINDWQTWIKHQVDFHRKRRIAVTGSAIPLDSENVESGVGRWHTIKLPTLSFYEYLKIKSIPIPELPDVRSLTKIFDWNSQKRIRSAESARGLVPHFHEYLLRGGFPETANIENIIAAQKLLREDIVDKVLKRDMTALYGVRRVLELEKTFLYLCLHDGGILDLSKISESLEMPKPTVSNFISLLESAHMIYRLHPFGYGKQILRGKHKVYLADAAISGSVLLKGKSLLQDTTRLGAAVETAFFKHVFTRYYRASIAFSYWRDPRTHHEVDIVADTGTELIPFEVKYQSQVRTQDLKGLYTFSEQKKISRAYVITRELNDFAKHKHPRTDAAILTIPAVLACYWLAKSEIDGRK